MKRNALLAIFSLPILALAGFGIVSGLAAGAYAPDFDPTHVWGPDKGTNTCPVCKYGPIPAVQVWVNGDDWNNVARIASTLETATNKFGADKFKSFAIYMNPEKKSGADAEGKLVEFAKRAKLNNVAVTYIPNPTDPQTAGKYQVNPEAKNTVFVYSGRRIMSNFVNLTADKAGLDKLNSAISAIAAK